VASLLPPQFLFRYALEVRHHAKLPLEGKRPLALGDEYALIDLSHLAEPRAEESNGSASNARGRPPQKSDADEAQSAGPFGRIFLAWNDRGLGIALHVEGRTSPLRCSSPGNANLPSEMSDGLTVWIDTRNTQNVHRASRFCHEFCLIPAGAGSRAIEPWVLQRSIGMAREFAPRANLADFRVWASVSKTGYVLETWMPAESLTGYDPSEQPKLGFYYELRDHDLGEQYPGVGRTFPVGTDPSLWTTLELAR
jgi:hypothetical protein